ncbi:APC family permease [Sulfuracidifex metallicus DSM 6482 = JCM 9184]|nr:APC family permease [Sulfuracidifex metallicus DSM 6482 = JCM 9184]
MGELKGKVLHILDLVTLSTSSVAPAFSISAAYGSMVLLMGIHATMSVIVSFPFFLFASIILRKLNKVSPNAGASYHWGAKLVGPKYGSFQFWIVSLAYFLSLPPIVIPAGEYTLDLLYRIGLISHQEVTSIFLDSMVGIGWVLVATVPLLLGAKPTAKITEAFLAVEIVVLSFFILVGLADLGNHNVKPISTSIFLDPSFFNGKFLRLAATMVIVATILDGWEIDSYASEEAKKPRQWPGLSGIIGLVSVFMIYLITMPIMAVETPEAALSSSVDPLATWASFVIPGYVWTIDIAVIASTASSLWLTAYILSRVWFSAGREGLLPHWFSSTRVNGSPWIAILAITALEILVQLIQLSSSSLQSFFGLVLTSAGAFLLLEFGMDSLTVIYMTIKGKFSYLIGVVAGATATFMFSAVILGIAEAGTAFNIPPLYYVLALMFMLSLGGIFILRSRKLRLIEPDLEE